MPQFFTASVDRNPGRRAWFVQFRHPLKPDNAGRPGRKFHKGLGTESEAEAQQIASQLNELLADESLWSIGAEPEAKRRFGPESRAVAIFYGEIQPRTYNARAIRDKYLRFEPGYARALLLGVPGAGKTTLLRQLIGSDPNRDRFPSTSVNRTTTFPTEVITRDGDFAAVVTFLSEHEARFEVEECVSSAIVKAVERDRAQTATAFLEPSDMQFRLKYLLGDLTAEGDGDDPYANESAQTETLSDGTVVSPEDVTRLSERLEYFVDRICAIASRHRDDSVSKRGPLSAMEPEVKRDALDSIQTAAENSDEYTALVAEILEDLQAKFDAVMPDQYVRSTTGWPLAWRHESSRDQRAEFLKAVRFFSGISIQSWGKLLTPLVNGIRVAGPFFPSPRWWSSSPRVILTDTEGLLHRANTSADLPEHIITMFDEADSIVLVASAAQGLNFTDGKALEAVVTSGQTSKLLVAFTNMDRVKGENLRGKGRRDHVLGYLRNVIEHQVGKATSAELARYLSDHVEQNTFLLGKLDEPDPTAADSELARLLSRIESSVPKAVVPVAFPRYGRDKLVFAIQEAAQDFRKPWRAWLGIEPMADLRPYPWQSQKAMSRRYAEGWDDGYHLRPVSNLLGAVQRAISRFLETPLEWTGSPTEGQKREVLEKIKGSVTPELAALCRRLLREIPQPQWQTAYALRGTGSTFDRRMQIEAIYERRVPIPHSASGKEAQDFLDEIARVVLGAVDRVEEEVRASAVKEMVS